MFTDHARAALLVPIAFAFAGCGGDDPIEVEGPSAHVETWPATLTLPTDGKPRFKRVVLVTIDTLRADHLASYGYLRSTSPFVDKLAAEGTRFAQAMAPISHTSPSHASMFTGLTPTRHGLMINGQELDQATPTLAGMFAEAGWDTTAITSVHFLRGASLGFGTIQAERRSAREVTDAAIESLQDRASDAPLFLWAHYYDAHDWYKPEETADLRAAVPATSHTPDRLFDALAEQHGWPTSRAASEFTPMDWGKLTRDDAPETFAVSSREQAIEWIDSYDALIAAVDAEVARLFEFVEASAPDEPTLWIITSDHGEGLGGHGYFGHGRLIYQEHLHVPLIFFASDGSLPVTTVDGLVSLVDLAPTIAHLVGAPEQAFDPEIEGVQLFPLIGADPDPWTSRIAFAERRPLNEYRRSLGWQHEEVYSLQRGDWKLIDLDGQQEVYDLASDPRELHNVASSNDAERLELQSLLDAKVKWIKGLAGTAETPEDVDLDELRALGYVR